MEKVREWKRYGELERVTSEMGERRSAKGRGRRENKRKND